ncbi:pentatricopeptide repeat-containing protein At2g03380, mitochondrial-like [Chenopodium quinoa]|uniref:pentatricopeptide repeat-containing protein At2g03380, mitochondrial-like n=1 Tax=Chenopodium quinoa TaxID=63459 RepID=UPI000B784DF4|nr:pentatricopeptide repeat-containing protein At2g03380, mitochondrial-like [Chenopodium quinoa]
MRIWLIVRHFSSFSTSNLSSSKLTHLLQVCSNSRALAQAKQTHLQVIQHGMHHEPYVTTKLVQTYAECDHLGYARKLFDELPEPNVFAWTALLAFYSRNGLFIECLQVYGAMRFMGVLPDQYVFPKILRACAQLSTLKTGAMVHKEVIVCGVELNLQVCSSLIDMYSKCGEVDNARRVFDSLAVRDLLSWNAMISGYVANGFLELALELYGSMRVKGTEPDLVTLNSVMDAYCQMGLCDEALEVFGQIARPSVVSWTTLMSGYSRIGNHEASLGMFRDMVKFMVDIPDLDSLSSAMVSCRHLRALRNGQEIHVYGLKTHSRSLFYKSCGPALLTMYSKCSRVYDMRNVFELMDKSDVVTWNAMILGLADLSMGHSALETFSMMQIMGVKNDQTTISTILPICDLKPGKQIHAYILRNNLGSVVPVLNALISMYCKCGSIHSAKLIFSNMTMKDLVTWNTMIGGFAMHGKGEAALQMLNEMISSGLSPNSVTLTSVLSACNHSGLINEGLEAFYGMSRDFGLVPKMEHFACLVDMLARAGQLNEALDIVMKMPIMPDKHIWGTILAASQVQQNLVVAILAAENLVSLEPENAGHYVTLSNIYTDDGRWDDAMKVRRLMESRGLMKAKGSSWIEGEN